MLKDFSCEQNPKISRYLEETFQPMDKVLVEIHDRAMREGIPEIQLGAMDALHLEVLTRACNAKKAVEIGTLAGYSGVCILRGMGKDGKLFTFEKDPKHAQVAEESFCKAELKNQVQIFVGDALLELEKIKQFAPFDLVFIDADKENYPNYLDWATKHLRMGGLVIGDNTFAFGQIGDSEISNPNSQRIVAALQKFNSAIASGGHYRGTILPTGEGLSVGVKVR